MRPFFGEDSFFRSAGFLFFFLLYLFWCWKFRNSLRSTVSSFPGVFARIIFRVKFHEKFRISSKFRGKTCESRWFGEFDRKNGSKASTRQPGNFNDPRILWIHLHSYGGTTMCDLARAHGEKVSPPKDNCTFASLEIQVIYGFFISSIFVSKITKLLGQLIFWKENVPEAMWCQMVAPHPNPFVFHAGNVQQLWWNWGSSVGFCLLRTGMNYLV